MIIGHAGGDPVNFCENTLASTRSALKNGANAIEVDVAISKDNVVFLWHDPYPLGIVALARRWANYTTLLNTVFQFFQKCSPCYVSILIYIYLVRFGFQSTNTKI